MKFRNPWMGDATILEIMRHRKAAGYTVREDLDKWWRRTAVWWVLRLIPRGVKQYVVIQAATRQADGTVEPGNPGEVTAGTMLRRLGIN